MKKFKYSILTILLVSFLIISTNSYAVTDATISAASDTEGTGYVQFTVELTTAADDDVDYTWTVSHSTTDASDLDDTQTSTVSFTNGDPIGTSKTFNVVISDDAVVEADEVFEVTLTPPGGHTVDGGASSTVNGTITDDDSGTVSISGTTSGDEGGGPTDGQFTVTQTSESSTDTVLTYTVGGTASEGTDYTALSGTVTISAGSTSNTIDIDVTDDTIIESTETVSLTISIDSADAEITVGTASDSINIADDDSGTVSISGTTSGDEGGGPTDGQFTVTQTAESSTDTVLTYTVGGTASEGTDYTTLSGTVTISAGSTSNTIDIDVTDDALIEDTETVSLTISIDSADPEVTLGTAGASINITDDDSTTISISAADAIASEPAGTDGGGEFTVNLDGGKLAPAGGIEVYYNVTGSTATSGSDYTALTGTVTIAAGSSSAAITVTVLDDVIVEASETVTVNLTGENGTYTSINGSIDSATVTINDDDTATFTIGSLTVNESTGTMTFTISLDAALDIDVDVDVNYTDGTATGGSGGSGAGVDYDNDADQVTYTAGQTGDKTVTVAINDDDIVEADETFTAAISTATALGSHSTDFTDEGTGTITNNDTAELSIVATTQAVEDSSDGLFTISTTKQFDSAVTVDLTVTGTATNGTDYSSIGSTIVFPALSDTTTITVDVTPGDNIVEGDETVNVAMTGTDNVDVTIAADPNDDATITITEDDHIPDITTNTGISVDEEGTVTINNSELQITDADTYNIASDLVYTIDSVPSFGELENSSVTLSSGDTFTQADIDAGNITYTHDGTANFTDSITISQISDGDNINDNGGAGWTVNITINPVNEMPIFTKGSDQTVLEDAGAQTIAGWATGIDDGDSEIAQVLTFNVTNDNNALFSSQPAIDSSGQLTYTPADDANGSATVTVSLTDDDTAGGAALTTANQTFTITVTAVNDEPSFTAGPDQTVIQGGSAETITGWATSISAGPTDESGQALTFHVSNDNNSIFSVQPSIDSSGTLTFTPVDNANGYATVSVYLTDDGGTVVAGDDDTSPTQTFTIKVQGAPVILVNPTELPYNEIDEGQSIASTSFILTNNNSGGYEALNLNYSISNNSGGWLICSGSGSLASGDSTTITVQYDTASLAPDTYQAYITITDPDALNDPVTIYVRVGVVGEITSDVGGSLDDAEEKVNGDIRTNNSQNHLRLGESNDGGKGKGNNNNQVEYVGVRFQNINIPAGSEIKSAYIRFQSTDNKSDSATFNIVGEYTGNAAQFDSADRQNISSRTSTSNSISWSPGSWSKNQYYDTPDLTDIVQEIVNQSSWSSGNAMAFIVDGSGLRIAGSYDSNGYSAPKLVIEYLPGAYTIIETDKTSLDLWIWEGNSLASETFTVANTGSGELNYTITDTNSDTIDWISVTPATGGPLLKASGPDTITINFDTTGLTAADPYTEYTGTITVSDPYAVNNPVTIDVSLKVYENKPEIEVDETYFGVTAYEGNDPQYQTFNLGNTGTDVLEYTITDDADADGFDWLSCSLSTGTIAVGASSVPITVTLDTDTLDPGTYEAYITIADPDAINTPVSIQVSVTVEPIPLSTACGDVPVYTENLVSPAILLLLDVSGSMAWNIDVASETQNTPDLKDIVQEIVDRTNWLSGNDMAFIITGSGYRPAYTYDGSANEAPILHVQFNSGNEVEVQVNSSDDDAEQGNSGYMNLDSSDLDLGTSTYNGICFNNVGIPQGAVIESAYIEFGVSDSANTTTNLTISGNDVDNASAFSTSNNNISGRTTTTASVSWSNVDTWTGPTQQPRIDVAQAALNELVTDKTISWGFGTWEGNFPHTDMGDYNLNYTKIHVGCEYNDSTHLSYLQSAIDAASPGGNTPLTPALNAGLDYFEGDRPDLKYSETFIGNDCQPTFVIVITDGMGNTGTTVTNVGTTTQALADYGVNTVGIGFGLDPEDTEQLYKLAEVSNDNGDDSDDDYLYSLHEVVNGVPQPFLAQSKEDLLEALKSITAGIKAEVFHGSAPAPTTSVDYGDIVITAKFQPADWSGDLVATQYDSDTGELTDELWSANDNMPSTINAYIGTSDGTSWEEYTDTTLANDSYLCSDKGLGDIIDSTPIIVEDPAFTYYFDNYLRGFKYVVDREPLVYIGSNDGALHAFMLADTEVDGSTVYGGEEVWRFYPTAVRDNLNKAMTEDHWDMCDEDTYCHRYFVDGSPVSGDIYNGSEWKTMLVCGLREGGEAYFALDITYGKPFDYSVDTTKRTKYMWEFTDTELGQTWADAAITRVYEYGATTTAWAVFFGSGYKEDTTDQAAKEAYLYGIEADDKTPLWEVSGASTNRVKISSTTLLDDALSPPMTADVDGNNVSDAIYVGNLYGSMYRVRDIGKDMEPVITKLFNFGDTDHNNPIRAKAAYGYTDVSNVIRICFGTGIYEKQANKYSLTQQYFFGLKEDFSVDTVYTMSSTDLVQFKAGYITDDDTGTVYRQITDTSGGTASNSNNDSWVIGLDNFSTGLLGSERVISQSLVVAGVVFFTTFIPDNDVCEGNGKAYLFAVDVETGLPPSEPIFDINGDGEVNSDDVITSGDDTYVPAGLYLGAGQPSKPVLHKDTLFVTTTGGGLTSLKVKPLGLSDMTSWKEKNN